MVTSNSQNLEKWGDSVLSNKENKDNKIRRTFRGKMGIDYGEIEDKNMMSMIIRKKDKDRGATIKEIINIHKNLIEK